MSLRTLFTQHGLTVYIDAFEREHVALEDLAGMSDQELGDVFGMRAYGDRKRFRAMVAELGGAPSAPVPVQRPAADAGATRMGPVDDGATRMGAPPVDPGATRMDGPGALPQQLGSYRILGLIGAGGMGTVLRARHMEEGWAAQQGGDVAIKLIHSQIASAPEFRARFLSEAALGRRVQHPGLVPTWDVIVEGGWLSTVMGFVSGEPLSTRVRSGGLPLDEALALLTPVGETLDHLHAQGIVHRDVKPANIVVRPDGRPVLLDLGIAKDITAQESHTRAMTAMGTSAWMAPEQADARNVDGAADRYAFGLMAYALLTGRMPWDEGTSEFRLVSMKLTGQLAPLSTVRSDLPPNVTAAVTRMLSVAPGERYASCADFVAAMRETGPRRLSYTVGGVSFDMVVVPPCTFVMGSPEDEGGRRDDETQHEVTLTRAYAVATTPVTQALYKAVMGVNPSKFKDGVEAPQRPVEQVSWFDAVRFCNALSEKAKLRPAYVIGAGEKPSVEVVRGADGFRLPTEAEWECAARSGGDVHVYAGSDDVDAVAWYYDGVVTEDGRTIKEMSVDRTQPVATKTPTRWGIYDLSGNVEEWCQDWGGAYSVGGATDPSGPDSGAESGLGAGRVIRGGSWRAREVNARVAYRWVHIPFYGDSFSGFRLARTLLA